MKNVLLRETVEQRMEEVRAELRRRGFHALRHCQLDHGAWNRLEHWGKDKLWIVLFLNTETGEWDLVAPISDSYSECETWSSLDSLLV